MIWYRHSSDFQADKYILTICIAAAMIWYSSDFQTDK